MNKPKYNPLDQEQTSALKSNNDKEGYMDNVVGNGNKLLEHLGPTKKHRWCNRQTIVLTLVTSLCLLILFCFTIGAIVSAYTGIYNSDQRGIWGLTICCVFMFLCFMSITLFAIAVQCISVLWKNRVNEITEGVILVGVAGSGFCFAAVIVAMYFAYCGKASCEPFNMVKTMIKKNETLS